ncbi:MAG TPA: class I tRNA ligase family protein, partial [Patescibacteria group bacterium]|nr:class I tRNA ligase family protein [Patescibacteria group bacterium]
METQLAKSYTPAESEQKWYVNWINENYFAPREGSGAYSILMPPPNVTGILHFGHILNNTLQDLYIRRNRMKGKSTVWFPGLDHAGIATQTKVEQGLRKEGISRHDLGREEFLKRVWEWKDKYGGVILKQLRTLGASPDWDRTLFTMDESASNAVREVFIRLFDEGLIYRGKRIINWSPVAQSALSDEEVNFKEVKEYMYTLRYYIEGMDSYISVSTARPETIYGDVAVAVNPNDERFKALIG